MKNFIGPYICISCYGKGFTRPVFDAYSCRSCNSTGQIRDDRHLLYHTPWYPSNVVPIGAI